MLLLLLLRLLGNFFFFAWKIEQQTEGRACAKNYRKNIYISSQPVYVRYSPPKTHTNSSANVILLFLADADEINRLYKYEPAPGRINKYLRLKID